MPMKRWFEAEISLHNRDSNALRQSSLPVVIPVKTMSTLGFLRSLLRWLV